MGHSSVPWKNTFDERNSTNKKHSLSDFVQIIFYNIFLHLSLSQMGNAKLQTLFLCIIAVKIVASFWSNSSGRK